MLLGIALLWPWLEPEGSMPGGAHAGWSLCGTLSGSRAVPSCVGQVSVERPLCQALSWVQCTHNSVCGVQGLKVLV